MNLKKKNTGFFSFSITPKVPKMIFVLQHSHLPSHHSSFLKKASSFFQKKKTYQNKLDFFFVMLKKKKNPNKSAKKKLSQYVSKCICAMYFFSQKQSFHLMEHFFLHCPSFILLTFSFFFPRPAAFFFWSWNKVWCMNTIAKKKKPSRVWRPCKCRTYSSQWRRMWYQRRCQVLDHRRELL